MRPARKFLAEEDRPDRNQQLLSSRILRGFRRFGADPEILGRVLNLSDSHSTVVGVLPP